MFYDGLGVPVGHDCRHNLSNPCTLSAKSAAAICASAFAHRTFLIHAHSFILSPSESLLEQMIYVVQNSSAGCPWKVHSIGQSVWTSSPHKDHKYGVDSAQS